MLVKSLVTGLSLWIVGASALAGPGSAHAGAIGYGSREGPGGYSEAGGCDYRDAAMNNGWGWNPFTGTSCPPSGDYRGPSSPSGEYGGPSSLGDCSYRDAYLNNGWGWNDVTGTSCPPL